MAESVVSPVTKTKTAVQVPLFRSITTPVTEAPIPYVIPGKISYEPTRKKSQVTIPLRMQVQPQTQQRVGITTTGIGNKPTFTVKSPVLATPVYTNRPLTTTGVRSKTTSIPLRLQPSAAVLQQQQLQKEQARKESLQKAAIQREATRTSRQPTTIQARQTQVLSSIDQQISEIDRRSSTSANPDEKTILQMRKRELQNVKTQVSETYRIGQQELDRLQKESQEVNDELTAIGPQVAQQLQALQAKNKAMLGLTDPLQMQSLFQDIISTTDSANYAIEVQNILAKQSKDLKRQIDITTSQLDDLASQQYLSATIAERAKTIAEIEKTYRGINDQIGAESDPAKILELQKQVESWMRFGDYVKSMRNENISAAEMTRSFTLINSMSRELIDSEEIRSDNFEELRRLRTEKLQTSEQINRLNEENFSLRKEIDDIKIRQTTGGPVTDREKQLQSQLDALNKDNADKTAQLANLQSIADQSKLQADNLRNQYNTLKTYTDGLKDAFSKAIPVSESTSTVTQRVTALNQLISEFNKDPNLSDLVQLLTGTRDSLQRASTALTNAEQATNTNAARITELEKQLKDATDKATNDAQNVNVLNEAMKLSNEQKLKLVQDLGIIVPVSREEADRIKILESNARQNEETIRFLQKKLGLEATSEGNAIELLIKYNELTNGKAETTAYNKAKADYMKKYSSLVGEILGTGMTFQENATEDEFVQALKTQGAEAINTIKSNYKATLQSEFETLKTTAVSEVQAKLTAKEMELANLSAVVTQIKSSFQLQSDAPLTLSAVKKVISDQVQDQLTVEKQELIKEYELAIDRLQSKLLEREKEVETQNDFLRRMTEELTNTTPNDTESMLTREAILRHVRELLVDNQRMRDAIQEEKSATQEQVRTLEDQVETLRNQLNTESRANRSDLVVLYQTTENERGQLENTVLSLTAQLDAARSSQSPTQATSIPLLTQRLKEATEALNAKSNEVITLSNSINRSDSNIATLREYVETLRKNTEIQRETINKQTYELNNAQALMHAMSENMDEIKNTEAYAQGKQFKEKHKALMARQRAIMETYQLLTNPNGALGKSGAEKFKAVIEPLLKS